VHETGVPFDDASGERLRAWMGMGRETFYDPRVVAILPMGFCYPGKGKSGDLPPRRECAPLWRTRLLATMPHIELTLVIGQYALAWHLPKRTTRSLTDTVRAWRDPDGAAVVPLPHPSPLNNIWLKANPWFVTDTVPLLQRRVEAALSRPAA
jgi:uracil-DNA glycosylase